MTHENKVIATRYDSELKQLGTTYSNAMHEDVSHVKKAVSGASESSIIGVGSGGSFTVASLLCSMHEAYTGYISRSATPLEIICNPTIASTSPVFIISAEGKNPDVIEATKRARRHSARSVHVITNRLHCPLMDEVDKMTDIRTHVYEVQEKDGYLATNSLLLDAVLLARTYSELNQTRDDLPQQISELRIGNQTLEDWINDAEVFINQCIVRGALTIVYSPLLKPIAVDLESKLSEAALLYTQFVDLRAYAHGRHLWLANRPNDCAVLALTEPSTHKLWQGMKELFPSQVPTYSMDLSDATPRNLIAGLIAQMYLVSAIAKGFNCDPGRPNVPQFGRDLYYLNLQDVIPVPTEEEDGVEQSKYHVLGARWPSPRNQQSMRRARKNYIEALEKQRFRALIFDYDGTLCSSSRIDKPPSENVLQYLQKFVHAGIIVGIASGRGGSIQECLKESLPSNILQKIQLGLYNGGVLTDAATHPIKSSDTSEFLYHVKRIIMRLKSLGVPIDECKTTHPYQVSVRFREGLSMESMWFVVADALRQAGLKPSSMVKSKHSIDILSTGITKSKLVAHIVQNCNIDPYEILTIGDQGAWPGNDSALLEHRFSLSVDVPSRRLDRGWKIAPSHVRDVDASLWYLQRFIINDDTGSFCVRFNSSVIAGLSENA